MSIAFIVDRYQLSIFTQDSPRQFELNPHLGYGIRVTYPARLDNYFYLALKNWVPSWVDILPTFKS